MRFWKYILPLLASTLCLAAQPDRISGVIDSSQRFTLPGRIHPLAQPKYDRGAIEPTYQFGYVTILFSPTTGQREALERFLAEQQDRKSHNFHKWLTPEQFADRFGMTANDMGRVTDWLKGQGLQVVSVARGRQFVVLGGSAAQLENAFRMEIHRYNVDGEMHFANATLPSIPAALSGIVGGFRGLDDFRMKPWVKRHSDYTVSGFTTHFIAPGDLYAIYNITPLQNAGFDGTGQKIAIMGQTDLLTADIDDYRTDFGLSAINLQQVLVPGTGDPGVGVSGDLAESDLDLEVSGSIAPSAAVIFVYAGFTGGAEGVISATQYAIDNVVAPVMSVSYGNCEFYSAFPGTATLPVQDLLYMQAAGEGISFFAASGDDGPATCDINDTTQPVTSATLGLAVNYPSSSAYVTGVGGTEFNDAGGSFWNSGNGTFGSSATGYIPEKAWNDFFVLNPRQLDGGGGGPSNCANQTADFSTCVSGFPKPSWQTGVGVPTDGVRDVPDVSFTASNFNDPYIVCTPLEVLHYPNDSGDTTSSCANGILSAITVNDSAFGGTSASAPLMAGIAVLLNQYLNGSSTAGLGLLNPTLYMLAGQTPSPFHDTPAGSNSTVDCIVGDPVGQPSALLCPTAGTFGFSTGTGYDLATGLGSIDANALALAWAATLAPDFQLSVDTPSVSLAAGHSTAPPITLTISAVTGSTAMVVNFSPSSCSGLPAGATCSFNPISVNFDGINPVTTAMTISTLANMAVPLTASTVTVKPTNSSATTTTVSLTVTATDQTFTLTAPTTSFSIAAGAAAPVQIAVAGTNGFIVLSSNTTAVPLTYACSSLPSETTCIFSPSGGQLVSATAVTLSIKTTAPTAELRFPLHRSSRIFYALLLPGLFGIVFAAGSRGRGARLLGLIVVLGFSTLWLGSCGGSSSTGGQSNPGTTPGTYSIVVSASTLGPTVLTSTTPPLTIMLTVTP